ncbi:LOW QUALITY PROTEIN: hypothetical protein HID58_090141, partial [Brassica napus]
RNKLIGSPFTPPCPSRVAAGGRKKEREGWGFSRFWLGIAGPSRRPARRAISSVVERAPDNCVVVPGLALSHMDSSMCSSAPDPEMWIIQGTLAWRTPPVRTGVRSNVDPTFYSLVGSGRSGGDHHGSSLLENPYIPYQCMDSYLSSAGLGSASMGK